MLWGLFLYLQTFSESSIRLQNTWANSMIQTSFLLTTFMQFGASKSYDSKVSQAGDECNFIQIPAASPEAASIWVYGLFCFFSNWPWLLPQYFFASQANLFWNLKTLFIKVDSWWYWTHVWASIESPFLWPSQTQIGSGCQFLCKSSVLLQKWRGLVSR